MGKNEKIKGDLNGLLSQFLIRRRQAMVTPYVTGANRVLDVGCGVFRWGRLIMPSTTYVGIDIEPAVVLYNQEHFPYTFSQMDIENSDLSILGGDYDLIIMLAVVEHLHNPSACLNKMMSMLSNNGYLVITTPHPFGNSILNIGSFFRIFSQDKHTHNMLLGKNHLEELAIQVNAKVVEYERFLFGFNQKIVLIKK